MSDTVTLDFGAKPPTLLCRLCGAQETIPLPAKLATVTDRLDQFTAAHAKCADKGKTK